MIQMVLNDWKGQKREAWKRVWRGSWDTDGKNFSAPVFLFQFSLYGVTMETGRMGKIFYGIECILFICMVMVNYMFPNKINKAMALTPFTIEEKRKYLKTSFWMKVGGFSILQMCFTLFFGVHRALLVENGIFLCISVFCWNVVMGMEENKGKNGIHTLKLVANMVCTCCVLEGIQMDFSIFENWITTIITSVLFVTECFVVCFLMKKEWMPFIERAMCFDVTVPKKSNY